MIKFIILNLVLFFSLSSNAQTKITPADLKLIVGNWVGTITYLDYQTNKPYTMPANLIVKQGRNKNILKLHNIYPKEPKANSADRIKITANGMLLNKNAVTERDNFQNGKLQIITEHEAKDDKKKALIRFTYIIGSDLFIVRKEVKFEETKDWILRSEFNYKKKA